MKAAVCREFGKPLVIEEVHLADAGPGEVRVKLSAVAICHSDISYVDGAWGGELPACVSPRHTRGVASNGSQGKHEGRAARTPTGQCPPAGAAQPHARNTARARSTEVPVGDGTSSAPAPPNARKLWRRAWWWPRRE